MEINVIALIEGLENASRTGKAVIHVNDYSVTNYPYSNNANTENAKNNKGEKENEK